MNPAARGAPPRAPARPTSPVALPLHTMPGHLLRRAHQQSVALYATHTAEFDLTPVQYAALHAIAAWPDRDQSTIGRAIACDKATVGAVLDRLQAKGLVERIPDDSDRRAWRLRATDDGIGVLRTLEPRVERVQRELLAPLTAAQAARLTALLARLVGPVPDAGPVR